MADDNTNNQPIGGGQSLGGNSSGEALPASWANRAPAQSRFGRIADLSRPAAQPRPRPGMPMGVLGPNNSDDEDDDEEHDHDHDDEDGEGQPQQYFAGGERSGINLQNPESGRRARDPAMDILRSFMESTPAESPARRSRGGAFSGSGNTLGSDEVESRFIQDPDALPEGHVRVNRQLILWHDGFSIDQGPLFRFDDPANVQIIAMIKEGKVPTAIFNASPNEIVHVEIVPRIREDYVAPRTAWTGGNRLGAPVPGDPSSSSSTASASTSPAPPMPGSFSNIKPPTVDETQPVAQIQVRLRDGSRFAARLNLMHTVADLRALIDSAHPSPGSYTLQTTFPTVVLNDTAVVGPAKLSGAVVVQRPA
uniref:P47 protein isoform c n=1 Tax=Mycena chlorophos TaxID=658473 RepID=A0ABQ0M8Q7_MYCCL|nr:p47 protein isoform c [Mycena chlorophos]